MREYFTRRSESNNTQTIDKLVNKVRDLELRERQARVEQRQLRTRVQELQSEVEYLQEQVHWEGNIQTIEAIPVETIMHRNYGVSDNTAIE